MSSAIPMEVLCNILSFLPNRNLTECALVHSEWHNASRMTFIQYRISKRLYEQLRQQVATAYSVNSVDDEKGDRIDDDSDADDTDDDHNQQKEENGQEGVMDEMMSDLNAQGYFAFFVRNVMYPIQRAITSQKNVASGKSSGCFISSPPLHFLIDSGLNCEVLFEHLVKASRKRLDEVDRNGKNAIRLLCERSKVSHMFSRESSTDLFSILVDHMSSFLPPSDSNSGYVYRPVDTAAFLDCLDNLAMNKRYDLLKIILSSTLGRKAVASSTEPMSVLWKDKTWEFLDEHMSEIKDCIELLVENGYDWNLYPLNACPVHIEIIKQMMELGVWNSARKSAVERLIHSILRAGFLEAYDYMFTYLQRYDAKGQKETRRKKILELLDPRVSWMNSLHTAAASGRVPMAQYIRKQNPTLINAPYTEGSLPPYSTPLLIPLHFAVQEGKSLEMVKFLLESGADPMVTTRDNFNSIHLACKVGCLEIFEYLRSETGASYHIPSTSVPLTIVSNSFLLAAAQPNNYRMIHYILSNRPDDMSADDILQEHNRSVRNVLTLICKSKVTNAREVFNTIKYLFSFGITSTKLFSVQDEMHANARVYARTFMPPSIVTLMDYYCSLESHLLPIVTSIDGSGIPYLCEDTNIMAYICESGDTDLFKHARQSSIWTLDISTPIHMSNILIAAAFGGNSCIIENVLGSIDRSANIDWSRAICKATQSFVQPSEIVRNIQIILKRAFECGYRNDIHGKKWVNEILDDEVSSFIREISDYNHQIHISIHMNDIESVKEILKKNQSTDWKCHSLKKGSVDRPRTAIQIACSFGNMEVVRLLIESGSSIDYMCFMNAAASCNIQLLNLIIQNLSERGVVDLTKQLGNQTVLHYVLLNSSEMYEATIQCIAFLIRNGCFKCLSMADGDGLTPVDLAQMINEKMHQYLSFVRDIYQIRQFSNQKHLSVV